MNRRAASPEDRLGISLEPAPEGWRDAALRFRERTAPPSRAATFRRQIGLPTDRPIVMTGHQAALWHAGVLAKFIACEALAERVGAAAAWIVPDQDEASHATVRIPVRDGEGRLGVETATIDHPPARAAAGSCPAFTPDALAVRGAPALEGVARGVDRALGALNAHVDEWSAGAQVQAALTDLLSPLVRPAPVVFASRLHETDLFMEFVERLRTDAAAAARAYNDAAAAHPQAGVAPLLCGRGGGRCELPLWRLRPGRPREPVFAETVGEIPRRELAPKGLLMSGLLRLGGCDLFIHGTGGGVYDRITEAWLDQWLGEELAPLAVATATLTLPLPEATVDQEEAHRAAWRAHHARHHPGDLGDPAGERTKMALVQQIEQAEARSEQRADLFRQMHELLARERQDHAAALDRLDRVAARAKAAVAARDVALDRTWPFPWHADADLERLAQAVRQPIAGAPAPCAG